VPEAKALKDRKEKYGDYEVVESDFDQSQLWVVDVAAATRTGAPLRAAALTSDPRRSVGEFDWSPDSKRIAFAATPSPLLAYRSDCDVYLVERAHPEAVKAIVALPGPDDAPAFSPDGSEIAFETALGEKYHYYANGHIASVRLADVERRPARAAADVRDRTASFDEDAGLLAWGPDGIYMTALRRTDSHIFRIPAAGEVARVSSPDRLAVSAPSFTRDFKTAAFVIADNGDRFHWHFGIKMFDVECEIASRAAAMTLFLDKLRNAVFLGPVSHHPVVVNAPSTARDKTVTLGFTHD